jgi:hypothetical protein
VLGIALPALLRVGINGLWLHLSRPVLGSSTILDLERGPSALLWPARGIFSSATIFRRRRSSVPWTRSGGFIDIPRLPRSGYHGHPSVIKGRRLEGQELNGNPAEADYSAVIAYCLGIEESGRLHLAE